MATMMINLSSSYTLFFLITPIFLFIIAILIIPVLKCKPKSKENTQINPLPPGPKPWPILGSLPELLFLKPTFKWIHNLMNDMKVEILCIRLGNIHIIPLKSPEIACEFLKQHDRVFSSRPTSLSTEIFSSGYLTTAVSPYGDQWKKMRRILVSEVLSTARHRMLQGKRDEEANHLIRFLLTKTKTKDGLVNMRSISQHYSANLLRKIVFGKRYFGTGSKDGGPGPEEEEFVTAIFTALRYMFKFCISDYIPCLRGRVDLDHHEKNIRWACATMKKHLDPLVEERIRLRDGGRKENNDILDVLVSLKDENGEPILCSEEIKAQIMELMTSVDNPSNTVEWTLAEMLNQPEILECALNELDRVVGNLRLVQESDISKLNYLKACIMESLRLHPLSAFNVPHVSDSDTIVAGYFIPKGSHVLISRYSLGRNSRVWPDPLQFRPNRHLEDGSDVVLTDPSLKVLSFSTGRRGCVGTTLGTTMTVMLLARMIHAFSFTFPPGVSKIELEHSYDSLELMQPLVVTIKPRLGNATLICED